MMCSACSVPVAVGWKRRGANLETTLGVVMGAALMNVMGIFTMTRWPDLYIASREALAQALAECSVVQSAATREVVAAGDGAAKAGAGYALTHVAHGVDRIAGGQ